jgi:VWFA-related protein
MRYGWSVLLFAALATAQQPPPKFKARVDLAVFDVEVLDRDGAPVPNLRREDFAVLENGKAREISNFAWEPDRLVSLVMILDTSGVPVQQLVSAKRFMTRLAHVLAPDDEIAVMSFDHRDAYLEMEFTRNRPSLIDVLENIEVPYSRKRTLLRELYGQTPRTGLAVDLALDQLRKGRNDKRAILLLSNRFKGLGPVTTEHVTASGATVMTVTIGDRSKLRVVLRGDPKEERDLVHETGGRRFSTDAEDTGPTCRAIARSLKNHYTLGVLVDPASGEKQRRKIEVKVPGKDYLVFSRRSYQR